VCDQCDEILKGKKLCCLVNKDLICRGCSFVVCSECFDYVCECPERNNRFSELVDRLKPCDGVSIGTFIPHWMNRLR